ncbi:AMP-binding protein [Kineococcus terrestris]|uniref:AMP-binding protein n=1 Tax=Kineococcus terrestris TaxID=2044856 RepID=UPI0034DB5A67
MSSPSISRALTWLAQRSPGAVAVRCEGRVLTREELDRRTNALARRWIEEGVRPDDVVTVALPNGVDAVLAHVAAWKAGATPQPLSPRLPEQEREAVLALTRPALVVDAALGDLTALTVGVDDGELPDLAASSWKAPTSSGSTGRPKVVRAAAPARVDPTAPVAPFVPLRAVQLVAGPLSHAAPFTYAMRGLMTGHELVVVPRFDAGRWLELVAAARVTWGLLVPATMLRVWRHPARAAADVSSLESVLHLGARCAPWLKRAWIGWLGAERVHEVYASTESQGLTFIDGADWLRHPGSVGRPLPGSRFRVVRPDLTDCRPGEVGEVLMRRDVPTYTYLGAEPPLRDGWHASGDSGWLDADGYLHVGDRIDDVVVSGGEVVVPADVEAVLEEHPRVRSAVVVGVADEELGQRVRAVVDGSGVDEQELDAWVAARLPPRQRPASWRFVTGPLRDDTGKVRRGLWRDDGVPSPAPRG